jgi:bacillopeptidase F (M6 metalloprotease family)
LCDHADTSRVDVAELADLRIDQTAATTENTHRFFAQYPASHVKVMDHHISKEPA